MAALDSSAASLQRLQQACVELGLPLSSGQGEGLLAYLAQMQRWNRTYNLTALRDADLMLVQHVFDSLAVLAPLDDALHAITGRDVRLYDIGSGAGLPGVVLALMRPRWHVTCIDAVEKKTAFVRQMTGALALPNLAARHARVETLPPGECDVVVSRAFASLVDFATLAGRHVAPDGWLLAMKGKTPDDEMAALHAATAWQVTKVEPLFVPELDAQRCLVWMRRSQGTL